MGKKSLFKKATAFAIITIFFTTSILPTISGNTIENNEKQNMKSQKLVKTQEDVVVTCYTFGMLGEPSKEIELPLNEAEYLLDKIKELNFKVASDPLSEEIQQLQDEIVDLADGYGLLPTGLSKSKVKEHLVHSFTPQTNRRGILPTQSKASEFLCTFVSTGSGGVLPIIALPRLIPILMIPIPRLFMRWKAQEAMTSCGGLRSGTGFIAYGQQKGVALGFWGLGFTFSLPPFMGVYGLVGYALFATVTAEEIEFYPPNNPPEISQIDPSDGEINVPLSLSELRFQISDYDGDLMSYTVTTEPDIGSGSGNLKKDGVYSVPISGLQGNTNYMWQIEVTDGKDTTENHFTFTTETVAPVVSNPSPFDGDLFVSIVLSQLSFALTDYQGDLMDYTVETSPDIGSSSGTSVSSGRYTVNIYGMYYNTDYRWYVNVTDGTHWTYEEFTFKTDWRMEFDPFLEGWQYRKQITINQSKIDEDLTSFPVLIHSYDSDLRDKAQENGNDILFMDDAGVATRLYHEIELYDDATGELIAWINVSNLSGTEDTVLYMYYGNPECNSQTIPMRVWDSTFEAVYHMSDYTSSSVKDATGNGHTMIKTGTLIETAAKIGMGQDMEASTKEYLSSTEIIDTAPHQDFTVSCWFNPESLHSHGLVGTDDGDDPYYWSLQAVDGGEIAATIADGSSRDAIWDGPYSPSMWYYVTLVVDRGTDYFSLFINGIEEASTDMGDVGNYDDEASMWFIGHKGNLPDGNWRLDGLADEVQISKVVRSSGWIHTSYQNQNDPWSFASIGPEEPVP